MPLSLLLTCEADCLLDDDPDVLLLACMAEVCLRYSTSLKTFLSPPPALCFTLSIDPTLLSTLISTFSLRICKIGGAGRGEALVSKCVRVQKKSE